ncbi:MAG: hypothetical protein ABFD96_24575 [Armatimonadia bacterium]
MEKTETTVTADDVQQKWHEVEATVKSTVQRKVMGMSYVTIGAIVVGAGALGAAYWLGRRSGSSRAKTAQPKPGESFVGLESPQLVKANRSSSGPNLGKIIEPAVHRLVSTALSAATDRMKGKSSCEARL